MSEPNARLYLITPVLRDVGAFSAKLANAARAPLPLVGSYYDLLCGHSARLDIWHTAYNHPLADAEAIVEWVKATGLKPFLDPLDAKEQKMYLDRYATKIGQAYPKTVNGKVLLRFPRIFIVAKRAA